MKRGINQVEKTKYKSVKTTEHLQYIDSLKGVACILVMLGHFMGIYKYAENATTIDVFIVRILTETPLKVLVAESLWLLLFFVISGYLIGGTKVGTLGELAEKIICRFFRLWLPILGACLVIMAICEVIGFYNDDTKAIFECQWYQKHYTDGLAWKDIFKSSISTILNGGSKFNSPYWVIKDMYFSSIYIYCLNYLKNRFQRIRILWIFGAILIVMFNQNMIKRVCIVGMLLRWCESQIKETVSFDKRIYICSFSVSILLLILDINQFFNVLAFSVILFVISEMEMLKKILSCKFFQMLGKINFGIYSFHWPLYCAVGALVFLHLYGTINTNYALLLMWTIVSVCCILVSVLYCMTWEKFAVWLISILRNIIKRICEYVYTRIGKISEKPNKTCVDDAKAI